MTCSQQRDHCRLALAKCSHGEIRWHVIACAVQSLVVDTQALTCLSLLFMPAPCRRSVPCAHPAAAVTTHQARICSRPWSRTVLSQGSGTSTQCKRNSTAAGPAHAGPARQGGPGTLVSWANLGQRAPRCHRPQPASTPVSSKCPGSFSEARGARVPNCPQPNLFDPSRRKQQPNPRSSLSTLGTSSCKPGSSSRAL